VQQFGAGVAGRLRAEQLLQLINPRVFGHEGITDLGGESSLYHC
jgi:hypothetical protein